MGGGLEILLYLYLVSRKAKPMLGIDYLAGAKYQSVVLNNHPRGYAAGFFADTFGNAYPVVRKLAKSGKAPIIRVHGLWDDKHDYNPNKDWKQTKTNFQKLIRIAKDFPKVKFQYSPFCEHNLKRPQIRQVMEDLAALIPHDVKNLELVNTPWQGALIFDGSVVNEVHGTHAVPQKGSYQYSFDGLSVYNDKALSAYNKHKARSTVVFLWEPLLNLKDGENDKRSREERLKDLHKPKRETIQKLKAKGLDFKNRGTK